MAFITVNGAELYYETFGQERAGKVPILLIHGSTGTGASNWSLAAPLLAREYFVIVPDCRGHGRSSNPNRSYSFKELAADTTGLIRGLGFERAHVIGHSNGGNVALVTLVEHPEVVQTCLPQAANAWVSPDLVEKEPGIFDPERVERENPEWKAEMLALHAAPHGTDYWKELLSLTVEEIIREPNYSPADLARVQRPTLVVQGELDRVNAPYRHAQFIARHIPAAELWIPAGIGHNVHDEIPFPWVEKVLDFLNRRGDEANDALYRLGQRRYRDGRESLFHVRAERRGAGKAGERDLKLSGQVLLPEQRQAALDLFAGQPVEGEIQVLLTSATPWALCSRNVTDLRREPRNLSERVSQVLLGEAVRILEEREDWAFVRLESDGYLGWIQTRGLHRCDEEEAASYRRLCTHIVSAGTAATGIAAAYASPGYREGGRLEAAGKLPFGALVRISERRGELVEVCLPGEERWWAHSADLLPLSQRPGPDEAGIFRTLQLIRGFTGAPYLWGGRTPFGYDCSGLAQAFWGFMGVQLPRDADQQFRAGTPGEGEPRPGDLLFFGEARVDELLPGEPAKPPRPITHVAISLGGDLMIHANGSAWGLSYNSLDEESPLYQSWLKENLVGARRFGDYDLSTAHH
jgi:pimeloyl-ACP methyl ester carboxylesterase